MKDLKDKYFFIIDFFMPENENICLKEFKIVNKKDNIDLLNYFIYPIEYKGFFNSNFYILLEREDFLFQDKQAFLNEINEYLSRGAKNIYSLNFKNLDIRINAYIDEFDPPDNYLLLRYELTGSFNGLPDFKLIITSEFLNSFINGLLKERGPKEKKEISDILSYLKLRLYRDSITSFWDLKNFVKELKTKDIQNLLNLLLKSNIVEETMLAGFIAGFSHLKIRAKLINNLSKNIRADIRNNLTFIQSDRRWIKESSYLIRTGIEKLLFNNQLDISHLNYILQIKERIKKERYLKIFQDRSYEDYLLDAYTNDLIEKIKLRVERKTILISLKNCAQKSVKYFLEKLSKNAGDEFKEDMAFYAEQISKEENVFKERIKVIEALKDLIYEKKAEDIIVFKSIILNLSSLNLNLLIEETGVIKFVQATINEKKELKKHILNSIKGIVRELFIDLYSGKVRFKRGFGEATINKIKKEILKTYYFLKESGKMI